MWWLLIPILLYFSYSDWKTREIDDRVVYASFLLGLLLNTGNFLSTIWNILFTLLVAGPLYLAGAYALGDLWTALIIAAYFPESIMGIPVAVLSLLGGMALGGLWGFLVMVKKDIRGWLDMWLRSLAYATAFAANPLAGIILSYTLSECYPLLFVLLPLTKDVLPTAAVFLLGATAIKVLKEAGSFFTVEKEAEEGDIPAEVIDKEGRRHPLSLDTIWKINRGEIKPVHSIGADGLSKEDVERLKKLGIEKIRVKQSFPMIPFITVAFFIVLVLKLYW